MVPESPSRITVSRDSQADLTTVVVEGTVVADQVRDQILEFLTGEPTRFVVWDIRRGSLSALSADAMRLLVMAGAPYVHRRRGGRTAIVCDRDLDFGVSRVFQTIAELEHVPFEIRVFRDIESAMAWLELSDGAA